MNPIHAVILDSDAKRHPQVTFTSVEEAFGPDKSTRVRYGYAVERFRKPSKALQVTKGVSLAILVALALVGLLGLVRTASAQEADGDCFKKEPIPAATPHPHVRKIARKHPSLAKPKPKPAPEEEPCEGVLPPAGPVPFTFIDEEPKYSTPAEPDEPSEPLEFPKLSVWPLEPAPWEPECGCFGGAGGGYIYVSGGGTGGGFPSTPGGPGVPTPVPEPAELILLALGLPALVAFTRHRRRHAYVDSRPTG